VIEADAASAWTVVVGVAAMLTVPANVEATETVSPVPDEKSTVPRLSIVVLAILKSPCSNL
jgi:hypothetical protein